ncbi:MAG: glycosyltransferase family 9 protein [Thermodesulfobacteriota bacterium]
MTSTLVINLTRFGDLLQTQPVISALKKNGQATGLVCLENFASATDLLAGVDHTFPLPGARFLRELDESWIKTVATLFDWVDSIERQNEWGGLLNLTASLSSKMLGRLIPVEDKEGFFVDEYGFGQFSNKWAIYLEASSGVRGSSPFNLVDVFLRVAGINDHQPEYVLNRPDMDMQHRLGCILEQKKPGGCRGYIGFQLGASADKRRWALENFARLGRFIWENTGLCPVLLGSAEETGLAERYLQLTSAPAINLVGRTNLKELAATLIHIRLLVTNDTGTMHLAAGLKVPVLAFFLATAQPWDTGPYMENALCLEPDLDCHPCPFDNACSNNYACRKVIQPQLVFEYINEYLQSGIWPIAPKNGSRVWLTVKRRGLMDLESRCLDGEDDRSRWMRIQRRVYSAFLDDRSPEIRDLVSPSLPFMEEVRKEAESLCSVFELLRTRGTMLLRDSRPQLRKKFMHDWHQTGIMLDNSKIFTTLSLLWKVHSQDSGQDIHDFLKVCRSYEWLLSLFGTKFE